MRQDNIATQTIPISQARQRFGELVNRVYRRQVRIILEKSGIPVAALVSLADLERWMRQELGETVVEQSTEHPETTTLKGIAAAKPPTPEELARRQAIGAKILQLREQLNIAPLTTADLIHQVREEREEAYERWIR